MAAELKTNLLYFGDNLEWLRNVGKFPDESVDLVYLDPPFNSNRNYNVLFKESDVAFGVFVCLNEPTKPMVEEALSHGMWVSDYDGQTYQKMQFLSAQDLIDGREVKMPKRARGQVFAKASREKGSAASRPLPDF